jgi:hypothetical protein
MTKIQVLSPAGARASPYEVRGSVLVKRCRLTHVWRQHMALGVDRDVWERYKDQVRTIQFWLWDGRVLEIGREQFSAKAIEHGDGLKFMPQLFVPIGELIEVRAGMQPLFN